MAVHHASTSHLLEHLRADAIDFFFFFFCAPASTSHSSVLGSIHYYSSVSANSMAAGKSA